MKTAFHGILISLLFKSYISTYSKFQVKQLEGYEDPYLKRPLKLGEIGCFLSHYFIWEEVVAKNYKQVIVLEDDVRFKPNFKSHLAVTMREVQDLELDWDLIYVSRKILHYKNEKWVPLSSRLVKPHYSYWTAAYLLSQSGARKLLAQQPLSKMMAVDEYLPLMFDKHPKLATTFFLQNYVISFCLYATVDVTCSI